MPMKSIVPNHRLLSLVAVFALALGSAGSLYGHTVGISRGEYRVLDRQVDADLVFARPELSGAIPGLDANHDGSLAQSEVAAGRELVERVIVRSLEVRSASAACKGSLKDFALTEEDGISVHATYDCPQGGSDYEFNPTFFHSLSHGHRHLATVAAGSATIHAVAYADNPRFRIEPMAVQTDSGVAGPLFHLGIQHILTGYDHLVFLMGLILIGGRVRPLLAAVTAFTVAHSITLGLATLHVWAPSSRFAESAIAMSIAYIGVENWFVKNASRRWLITFPFGLIHGFGFAGALQEISLPHAEIPKALFSFNAGVEAGQIAVVAVALPTILWLRRSPWFANHGVRALSGVIALAGIWWFLARIA